MRPDVQMCQAICIVFQFSRGGHAATCSGDWLVPSFWLGVFVTSEVLGSPLISSSHLRHAGCPSQKCRVRIWMQSMPSHPTLENSCAVL